MTEPKALKLTDASDKDDFLRCVEVFGFGCDTILIGCHQEDDFCGIHLTPESAITLAHFLEEWAIQKGAASRKIAKGYRE